MTINYDEFIIFEAENSTLSTQSEKNGFLNGVQLSVESTNLRSSSQ